jgi:cobaltochelatase CobS
MKKIPHKLPDFDVSTLYGEAVPESVLSYVPKSEDTYVPQGLNEYMFTKAMVDNQRVLLAGPKGSGKSTLPKEFAARTNRPFYRFQAQRTTEAEDLFGNLSVRDGSVVWVDGPITMMARVGGIVCVDEVSLLQAGAAMAMQWLIEPNGKISLPNHPSGDPEDKLVTPHPDFRIVFTDNTTLAGDSTGQYVGTNVQNAAFRDRIDLFIRVNYMDAEAESVMVKKHVPGIPDDVLKNMLRFATEVRAGHAKGNCECTVSPRVLLRWAKDTVAFGNIGFALRFNFANGLSEEDETVVSSLYTKFFGERLPTV